MQLFIYVSHAQLEKRSFKTHPNILFYIYLFYFIKFYLINDNLA